MDAWPTAGLGYRVPAGTTPVLGAEVLVHVPATSANLGPGFDVLGLALAYGDELTALALPARGAAEGAEVTVTGEGAGCLPDDGTHLAARTVRAAWDAWGVTHDGVDLRLGATNRIPHGRGQGSSAAVIVASLAAAAALLPEGARPGRDDLFELAARLEGHPDNVAPAVYGGLTLSWADDADPARRFRTVVLAPHAAVVPLVAVPDVQLATAVARGLLPATVPHADAVANAGRPALLVHAVTSAPELLLTATEDRLHQDYRAPAMPASAALVTALRARGFAATISGAGPTVLVLVDARQEGGADAARAALAELTAADSVTWRVLEPGTDTVGVTVEWHPPVH